MSPGEYSGTRRTADKPSVYLVLSLRRTPTLRFKFLVSG